MGHRRGGRKPVRAAWNFLAVDAAAMRNLDAGSAAPAADGARGLDAICRGLTSPQAEAATHDGACLCIAGAGTGKTKTLVAAVAARIALHGIPAARIIAVTFTNKAAAEMQSRIRHLLTGQPLPSWIGTFHGLAARQLRLDPEVAELRSEFEILDADDSRRFVKRTVQAMRIDLERLDNGPGRDPLRSLCRHLDRFKNRLVSPTDAIAAAEASIAAANAAGCPIDAEGLRFAARVYPEYQQRLREANSADFGDLLLWPTRTMQRSETYRRRWAGYFDAVLADEYQDVNYAQYTWLRLLAADHGRIFVVGDDDQSIYGWRDADISHIRRFANDFPDALVVRLEENFRSTGHILAAANAVIGKDERRLRKTLRTTKPLGTPIELVSFRAAKEEAAGLAAEMIRLHAAGTSWDDVAILYRNNVLSRAFEEALMRARIPYALIGDVGFYARAEIKDALALLRLASHPDSPQSDDAFRRVSNVPHRGLGPKAQNVLEQEASWRRVSLLRAIETAPLPPKTRSAALAFADQVRSVLAEEFMTLADQLSALLDRTGYRAMLRDSRAETTESRLENLQELVLLAGDFDSAQQLLDHAALATGGPNEDLSGRVKLMSLHRAKGLEFPHVFLPAWEDGLFPSPYGDVDEERRLAYVGLTRGMLRVTVSYCSFRHGPMRPSPFIADIPDAHKIDGWLRSQKNVLSDHPSRERVEAARAGLALQHPPAFRSN
jgi:DNA helicase-2/ATP-dependent DNA helicase PcrA